MLYSASSKPSEALRRFLGFSCGYFWNPRIQVEAKTPKKIKKNILNCNFFAWFYVLAGPGSQTTYSNEGHNANSAHEGNWILNHVALYMCFQKTCSQLCCLFVLWQKKRRQSGRNINKYPRRRVADRFFGMFGSFFAGRMFVSFVFFGCCVFCLFVLFGVVCVCFVFLSVFVFCIFVFRGSYCCILLVAVFFIFLCLWKRQKEGRIFSYFKKISLELRTGAGKVSTPRGCSKRQGSQLPIPPISACIKLQFPWILLAVWHIV